jgi:hypothetical protein
MLVSIDEIRKDLESHYATYLKYVRVGNEYRFALAAEWSTPDHKQMIQDGETATSAAYCKVYRPTDAEPQGELEMSGYSSTLGIGQAADDMENITKLLLG